MQRNIIDYYPNIIRNIREIEEISKSVDIEFSKLKAESESIRNNMFVLTADINGIIRFESMFNIIPDRNQNLEERRANIIAKINNKKVSLNNLKEILLGYAKISFDVDYDNENLGIVIYEDTNSIQVMSKLIDEILPLNVFYYFVFRLSNINILIDTNNSLKIKSETHIRHNEVLKNNGQSEMDGDNKMNGFVADEYKEHYLTKIRMKNEICIFTKYKSVLGIIKDSIFNNGIAKMNGSNVMGIISISEL